MLDSEKVKGLQIYEKLYLTRVYDEAMRELSVEGFWSFYHGIIGEEAVPVGVCMALNHDDYVVPVHRTQLGVMVTRDVNLKRLTAELLGRDDGYCHGVSGTHVACMEKGVLSKTGVLGAGLTIAVGVALSLKLRDEKGVVAVFIGDGASSSGNFHESLNMAAIWRLPIIFVLENNQYAITTKTSYALAVENLSVRASAYGFKGVTVDGNDVLKVYSEARQAIERARDGLGPTLIECKTYRIMGHAGHGTDRQRGYRSEEEVASWKEKDPINSFRRKLAEKYELQEIEEVEKRSRQRVKEAIAFALSSPIPERDTVLRLAKEDM